MKEQTKLLQGMTGFSLIWLGQLVSLLGTGMTRFAFTIWAYEQTDSATVLSLVAFFSFGPMVILSPIAGALVDRWNRKMVLIISDFVAGMTTVVLLLLFVTGQLEIWHLYVMGALASSFEAFQFPAFSAAITMILDKEQYGRASGMMSTAQAASGIVAPILAGILLSYSGMGLIMGIDVITFLFAVGVVFFVHIPQPAATDVGEAAKSNLWAESIFGFQYIWQRPSLFGMQMMFLLANFFMGMSLVLVAPAVLAQTGNNEVILGTVQSAMGVGGLVGGVLMSFLGGPKNRVHGVLLSMAAGAMLGQVVLGIGRGLGLWVVGAFFAMFFIPIMNGSNQALWQAKVAPDVQGRVFATRRLLAQITFPLAMLLAGPLADNLFEPAMQAEGSLLYRGFGWLVGTGPGTGIDIIFVVTGVIGAVAALCGYLVPAVREIETLLPDYEPVVAGADETAGIVPSEVNSL